MSTREEEFTLFTASDLSHIVIRKGNSEVKLTAREAEGVEKFNFPRSTPPLLVTTSKVVSKALGLLVELDKIELSSKAKRIAKKTGGDPRHI